MKQFYKILIFIVIIGSHAFCDYFLPSEIADQSAFLPLESYIISDTDINTSNDLERRWISSSSFYTNPLNMLLNTYATDLVWHLSSYNNSLLQLTPLPFSYMNQIDTFECSAWADDYTYYNALLNFIEREHEKNPSYGEYYKDVQDREKIEPVISNLTTIGNREKKKISKEFKVKTPSEVSKNSSKEKIEKLVTPKTEEIVMKLTPNTQTNSISEKAENPIIEIISNKEPKTSLVQEENTKSSKLTAKRLTQNEELKSKVAIWQLPEEGPGFERYGKEKLSFGNKSTLETILEVGKELEKKQLVMSVGNISKKGGGHVHGHVSHKTGKDVDFRLISKSGDSKTPISINNSNYCREKTITLIDSFIQKGNVEVIFFDDKQVQKAINKKYKKAIIQSDRKYPHRDHIHIRFTDEEQQICKANV